MQLERELWNGEVKQVFIEKAKINSVVLNEAITMCRVKFYIGFIVQGQGQGHMTLGFEVLLR